MWASIRVWARPAFVLRLAIAMMALFDMILPVAEGVGDGLIGPTASWTTRAKSPRLIMIGHA